MRECDFIGNSKFHFLFEHVFDTEMTTFFLKKPQIEELIEEGAEKNIPI